MLSLALAMMLTQDEPQPSVVSPRPSLLIARIARAVLKREPKFINVPVSLSRMNENSKLADIVNRCGNGRNGPSLGDGRATDGHESTHMLQANLRNSNGGRVNAFYMMDGRAVIVKEPGIRKSYVARFIPDSLREHRYGTYVSGQTAWDGEPLYLADEWSAYINGCIVALDDATSGRHRETSDEACGPLELGIYCVAMAMAVEKYDPEYFQNETQFKDFMSFQWARAKEVFDKAAPVFPFSSQDQLLRNLRSSPDAEQMRQFIRTHLDGVWLSDSDNQQPTERKPDSISPPATIPAEVDWPPGET